MRTIIKNAESKKLISNGEAKAISWSPLTAVVYTLVLFFAAQLVAGLLLSIYPTAEHWSAAQATNWVNNSVGAQFGYVLLAESLTIGGVYGWLRRYKLSLVAIGFKRPRWRDLGYGLIAAPVYYVFYIVLVVVVKSVVHGLDLNQQQDVGFSNVHGGLALTLTFISLVILPPLAEEIMVRGFLYTSLRKAYRIRYAILLTSVIFALPHLAEGGSGGVLWIAGIDTFTLSLVLCYLRERTGSLWPGIWLHGLKNGIAFAALFLLNIH